ncbi:aldo/keto reductase [Anaeromicropila herbilytica]|uniref:Oxidoreductase n=1 Tax=Anaeromicropila herbilytica TaxID=2785025 RepID=A0A7R7IFX1_9FIRM|nr:aldo/keto reductase [Anaeromicropila herbilytica]BCN32513.1 oxidoreductase [Anaeromicropila herbilytica]
MAKLCLGTVQFGMKYGINNTLGQPSEESSFEMLDYAIENGIDIIDTAAAYGNAEELLGKYIKLRNLSDKIKVISKLRPNILENSNIDLNTLVHQEILLSLNKLNIKQLDGYLLHTPSYINNKAIVNALVEIKKEGYVKNIGVSIYDIEDGEKAIETGVVDYIQLPFSILDQRGLSTGFLVKAKDKGITIFARSAFLQGLFMMNEECIPNHLYEVRPYLKELDALLSRNKIEKTNALLHFVLDNQFVDYLVFGVDTKEQLIQDIEVFKMNKLPSGILNELENTFQNINKSIILPSLWAKNK